ncbi:hypothetical protein Scep_012901 [Stephania cephalantha]|uniref:Uncharacterized protein n=1 Tax=Stephania cephalantha TaxID=152367 RepID=A0AAP0P747_9MAGN
MSRCGNPAKVYLMYISSEKQSVKQCHIHVSNVSKPKMNPKVTNNINIYHIYNPKYQNKPTVVTKRS